MLVAHVFSTASLFNMSQLSEIDTDYVLQII